MGAVKDSVITRVSTGAEGAVPVIRRLAALGLEAGPTFMEKAADKARPLQIVGGLETGSMRREATGDRRWLETVGVYGGSKSDCARSVPVPFVWC